MSVNRFKPVLTIAGSDSGGGAGIQADIKTFESLGCYGTTAITAITAQNTLGVNNIFPVPDTILKQQIEAVISDFKPKVVKIGMLYNCENVLAVSSVLKHHPDLQIIYDPVMIASTGKSLSQSGFIDVVKTHLFPICTLITPNLNEASAILNQKVDDLHNMEIAAKQFIELGVKGILIKGGHLKGKQLVNYYLSHNYDKGIKFETQRVESNNLHGTGCTLSSAIAAYLTQGYTMPESIEKAGIYVNQLIHLSKTIKAGSGNGPLLHYLAKAFI